jgi:hypothetical protein
MSGNGVGLPWIVIRHDENGNRYRVGCYATREEAERITERFERDGNPRLYTIERLSRQQSSA